MADTKERPILFSAPMVRAILEGRKTQTRRVVKMPRGWPEYSHCDPFAMPPAVWWWNGEHDRVGVRQECPYGQPGDRLWVRETFVDGYEFDDNGFFKLDDDGECIERIWYRATDPDLQWYNGESDWPTNPPWKPSIHMPRWASRILLEVVRVRVERLQAINEVDAIAEGADPVIGDHQPYRAGFMRLWESINGPGSWELNPWVWVIEFREVANG